VKHTASPEATIHPCMSPSQTTFSWQTLKIETVKRIKSIAFSFDPFHRLISKCVVYVFVPILTWASWALSGGWNMFAMIMLQNLKEGECFFTTSDEHTFICIAVWHSKFCFPTHLLLNRMVARSTRIRRCCG
jgi:hypothetical protein